MSETIPSTGLTITKRTQAVVFSRRYPLETAVASAASSESGLLSDLYNLISTSSDAHITHRGTSQVLQSINVSSCRRRKIREPPNVGQSFLPARHRLINRLHPPNRLHICWHAINYLSVETIAHPNRNLRERIEHIQFGDCQPRQAIDPNSVPNHDRIEPSTPPRPSRRRPEFAAELANTLGHGGLRLRPQRAIPDARRVRLHDAAERVDRRRTDPNAHGGATRPPVGRRDVRIRPLIHVEQRTLSTLDEHRV